MARLLYITYGSYRVGLTPTSTAVELEDRVSWSTDDSDMSFSFQVMISADTPENYNTAFQAFDAAMKLPDQALTVVMDSQIRHTYDPAANTGLNPRASIRKVAGRHNTARSGRFVCTVTLGVPMDASGRDGRRSARVQVFTTTSGRRRVVIDATYTARTLTMGGVQGARAQFATGLPAFANSALTALGGTWELLGDSPVAADQNDKVASGARVYQELKYNQGVGSLDVAAIKDQKLQVNRESPSINDTTDGVLGDSWSVQRLQLLEAIYSADIDFDQTTDLRGLWLSTILPRLDMSVSEVAESTAIRSTPRVVFDPVENRISARVTYLADVGGAFLQMRESLAGQTDHGVILRPVWNGDPYARVRYQGPKNSTRTLTRQYVQRRSNAGRSARAAGGAGAGALGIFGIGASLGLSTPSSGVFGIGSSLGISFVNGGAAGGGRRGVAGGGGGGGDPANTPDQGADWVLVRNRDRETPFSIGAPANPIGLEGWVRSWVWVKANDVSNRPVTGPDAPGGGATQVSS